MVDYLSPVGRCWRTAGLVALLLAAFLFAFVTVILAVGMASRGSITYEGKPLWAGLILVAAMAITSGWLAVRLWNDTVSETGMTLMPPWFIQLFGIVLGVGILIVAVLKREPVLVLEMAGILIAMITINGRLKRRAANAEQQAED